MAEEDSKALRHTDLFMLPKTMSKVTDTLRSTILSQPSVYTAFRNLLRNQEHCNDYITTYLRPQKGNKLLDIGCGKADILADLPEVDYTGFDLSPRYIKAARERFGNKGTFFCGRISRDTVPADQSYDLVLAKGVLHHLNDSEAIELFNLAKAILKPTGRLVTLDGCYTENQSTIAKFFLSQDRGKYVRQSSGYIELARSVFPQVQSALRTDFLRIPYTHLIMDCSSETVSSNFLS